MSAPARAGVFVYASDLPRLAAFYAAVLGLRQVHATDEMAILASPDLQLLVHRIPAHIAAGIHIASPPVRREDCAIKFFATVPSLADAGATAASLGGTLFDERWQGPDFVVCNAMDPEGNVFQVRESLA
jgi:predicted enzyme related to lactoylglutathione lyase